MTDLTNSTFLIDNRGIDSRATGVATNVQSIRSVESARPVIEVSSSFISG